MVKISFNRESYGRDEDLADVSRTIGWFTSQYPVSVKIDCGKDTVSLVRDVYSLKKAFKDVNYLGLNYASLIYTTDELEFKHAPVTFNFLSSEFVFKNELFESINHYLFHNNLEIFEVDRFESDSYGVDFNVSHVDNQYVVNGNYALGTYIADEFNNFIDNIKFELNFIGNFNFDDGVVCCLSESQLGIYLDEQVNDKGTAYSTFDVFKCDDYSIDEIKNAIGVLIDKHPILKGRVLDDGDIPLLVCDSMPSIEIIHHEDYNDLLKPFNLDESVARFFIFDKDGIKRIFYDIHHICSDASSHVVINNELKDILNGNINDNVDLGFAYASRDSFEDKFKPEYNVAYEFFKNKFSDIDEVQYLLSDINGSIGSVSLPIRGIRSRIELFAHKNGITVSNLLNAVFAYTFSRFTGNDKVCYNFTEHGRHEDYSQNALGMFVRTIPVIVDCQNRSINEYLASVSDLILASMVNSIYPFRLLASEFDLTNYVGFEYNYDLNVMLLTI